MDFSRLLKYDPTSPSGLRWMVDRGWGGNGAKGGSCAGSVVTDRKCDYEFWRVTVKGRKVCAHRVVWRLCTGSTVPDGMEIDHIDGNALNNIFENLRVVTHSGNCRNQRRRSDNVSGVTGVHWSAQSRKWVARIHLNGRNHTIGSYASIEDATDARKKAEQQEGFHRSHGADRPPVRRTA